MHLQVINTVNVRLAAPDEESVRVKAVQDRAERVNKSLTAYCQQYVGA
jgi:hypothetical protein